MIRKFLIYSLTAFYLLSNFVNAELSIECKKYKNRISKIGENNAEKAISTYQKALEYCKLDKEIHTNLAVSYYKQGDYKKSLTQAHYAKELGDNAKVRLLLAKNYKKLGDQEKYEKELSKANHRDHENPEVIREIFYDYINNGKYELALKCKDKLLKIKNIKEDFYNLALAFEKLNNYEESITFYNKAINKHYNFQKAYYNLGNVYYKLSNYNLAKKNLDKSLSIVSDHLLTLKLLVRVSEKLGDSKSKEENLRKIIRISPNDYFANKEFGYLALNSGDLKQAQKYLLQANNLKPSSSLLNSLGYISLKENEYRKARSYFDKGLYLGNFSNPKIYNNYGVLYLELKQEKKAQNMFKKAIEVDKNYKLASKNLSLLTPK